MQSALATARPRLEKIKLTYKKYEAFVPAASFFAGVGFDLLTIGRIDQWSNIVQLAVYLVVALVLLGLEIVDLQRPLNVPDRLKRVWHYREEAAHFILGSLLSAFAIFFFKSSSFWGAFIFYVIIAACLVGNEISAVRRVGLALRVGLVTLCLASYFACALPVFWGQIGALPFLVAVAASSALMGGFLFGMSRLVPDRPAMKKTALYPFAGVTAGFVLFYFLRIIPPVPLSLTQIGIYRGVTKESGAYVVTSVKPGWRFWHNGDQYFERRPGERVYAFFSVFSPAGFREQIKVRWIYNDPKRGWQPSDAMPVSITGGRIQGFRGFAYKQNLLPGEWQVRIETRDDREIGRIKLEVVDDASTGERPLKSERL